MSGSASTYGTLYCVLGNDLNFRPQEQLPGNAASHELTSNAIVAFNRSVDMSDPWSTASGTGGGDHWGGGAALANLAIIQNVVDSSSISGLITLAANKNTENFLLWHNTLATEREIIGYNDSGSTATPHINWGVKYNLFEDFNNKDDTFAPENANRTGSWPVGYAVGFWGNVYETSGFPGEFIGPNSPSAPNTADYVDTGANDFRLGASSEALNRVPSGGSVLPYDLDGNVRLNDGAGSAGAYQYAVAGGSIIPILANYRWR